MRVAYYPGCSQDGGSAHEYGKSTGAVCAVLGIELKEIEGWNCCGSTPAHAISTELSAALCVRNLDLAAKENFDLIATPCPSCLSNLRAAASRMTNEGFRARVNELLDSPAAENLPDSTSVMQFIGRKFGVEDIASRVTKPLTGIKIAPYYGCLMSRPAQLMDFGDPENPTLMESLLGACGADVIDFPLKTVCCGAADGIPERSLTALNTGKILAQAVDMGADAVAVCCPVCHMNLDLRQQQASKAVNRHFDMPVLYFTQFMGLAMNLAPEVLGLDQLCVSAKSIVNRINANAANGGAR